jgi:hypothetical protein
MRAIRQAIPDRCDAQWRFQGTGYHDRRRCFPIPPAVQRLDPLILTTHFTFIKAVKMPLPRDLDFKGELERLGRGAPCHFAIDYSGDWGTADALLSGADAWYSVVGGLLPEPALKLVRAAQAGDAIEVRRIDSHFQPLWRLFKEFSRRRTVHQKQQALGDQGQAHHGFCGHRPVEPRRDCRRLYLLRGRRRRQHTHRKEVRERGSDGAGASGRTRVGMGCDQLGRIEDWLHAERPR